MANLSQGLFNRTADRFFKLITADERLESAWLTTLGHIEKAAGRLILGNLTSQSDAEEAAKIRAHAEDEMRHCEICLSIRPVQKQTEAEYIAYEEKLIALGDAFLYGFMGHPRLVNLADARAAYIHGGLSFEMFPYQIYSAYLKHTRLDAVKEALPKILEEENSHLALGRALYTTLPPEKQLQVSELVDLELEMAYLFVRRIAEVTEEFMGIAKPLSGPGRLEQHLLASRLGSNGWLTALSERHELSPLQETIGLLTRKQSSEFTFKHSHARAEQLLDSWNRERPSIAVKRTLVDHLQRLIDRCDSMAIAHAAWKSAEALEAELTETGPIEDESIWIETHHQFRQTLNGFLSGV